MGVTIKKKAKKKMLKPLPFKGKVPEGIVPELGLHEEKRDALRKQLKERAAKKDILTQVKDLVNANDLSDKELVEMRWSGYRYHTIADELQIWVDGKMEGKIPGRGGNPDPAEFASLHERVFATVGTIVSLDDEPGSKH